MLHDFAALPLRYYLSFSLVKVIYAVVYGYLYICIYIVQYLCIGLAYLCLTHCQWLALKKLCVSRPVPPRKSHLHTKHTEYSTLSLGSYKIGAILSSVFVFNLLFNKCRRLTLRYVYPSVIRIYILLSAPLSLPLPFDLTAGLLLSLCAGSGGYGFC